MKAEVSTAYKFDKMKRTFLFAILTLMACTVVISCKDKELAPNAQEEQQIGNVVNMENPFNFCGTEHNRLLDVVRGSANGAKGALDATAVYNIIADDVKMNRNMDVRALIATDRAVKMLADYGNMGYASLDKLQSDGLLTRYQREAIGRMVQMLFVPGISDEVRHEHIVQMERELLQITTDLATAERDVLLCFTAVAKSSLQYWSQAKDFSAKGPREVIAVVVADAIGAVVGGAAGGVGGAIALGAAASAEAAHEFL